MYAARGAYGGCPEDRAFFGRHTWAYMHTMAAYYPDAPSIEDQEDMRGFLRVFAKFYPCGDCGEHLA